MQREALDRLLARAGFAAARVDALAGDVSPRRYFRLTFEAGGKAIAAFYPAELLPAFDRFERSGALLSAAGLRVPAVLATDRASGWMVVEDVGEKTLFELALPSWEAWAPHFDRAIGICARLPTIDASAVRELNPPLDGPALAKELEKTWASFLVPRGLVPPGELRQGFERFLADLCAALGAGPLVPCHRDLMARNLVPKGDEIVVLDHQDLRLGPVGYDLASLLNDSLFPSPDLEARLLGAILPQLAATETDYRRAAVQRTLKAVGTFASFAERGSDKHLPLIPPTLGRALEQMAKLPEGQELARELARAFRAAL